MLRRGKGITLIELLVGAAVAIIVAAAAVPGINRMLVDQRLAALSDELGEAVKLAREEARRRQATVHLSNFTGDSWQGGWTIWHDADGDGLRSDSEMLRYRPAIGKDVSIGDGGVRLFSFDAQGRVLVAGGLRLCSVDAPGRGRELRIDADGRVESRLLTCDQ